MAILALLGEVLLVTFLAEVVVVLCWQISGLALEAFALPTFVTDIADGAFVNSVTVVAHKNLSILAAGAPHWCRFSSPAVVAVIFGRVANLVRCLTNFVQLLRRKLGGAPSAIAVESSLRLSAFTRLLVPTSLVLAGKSTRHDANVVLKVQCPQAVQWRERSSVPDGHPRNGMEQA